MNARPEWEEEGRDWPHREHSRFLRAGWVHWHVQRWGAGPTALLLHGTGAATHSWRDLAALLASDHEVIALDLPGHGFSRGRPRGGMTIPGMARAVAGLLDALGAEPALVVAHSAGAAVAARLVLDGRVRAPIVAFCPALTPFPGLAARLFPMFARLLFVNPFTPSIFARIARAPGEAERFLARATGSALDARGVELYRRLFATPEHCAAALEMMADWDLEALAPALPRLPVPLHIVHGERDAAVSAEAARSVPAASFTLLPGLGHLAHEERPDLAAEQVRAATAAAARP